MTEIIHALILGIIQGLTEFLPVSSSGHLNLFPWIFEWTDITESFDVALHLGTLLAMVVFFFKDWIELLVGGFNHVVKKEYTKEGKMFWYLVIATIPAGILSLILDKISDKIFEGKLDLEMLAIAAALIVMGIVLYYVDAKAKNEVGYWHIGLKRGVLIGMSQAIAAAFPGVSRSGITMTVARAFGIDRSSAARFSFMLAFPITLAAVVFDLDKFAFDGPFFAGVISSFVVGIFVIKFLLEYLRKGSYKIFAIYRVFIGLAVFAIYFIKR